MVVWSLRALVTSVATLPFVQHMSGNLLRWAIALSISAMIAGRAHRDTNVSGRGGTITFSTPARVFPLGNSTARTYGGIYADAFYAVAVGGNGPPG